MRNPALAVVSTVALVLAGIDAIAVVIVLMKLQPLFQIMHALGLS